MVIIDNFVRDTSLIKEMQNVRYWDSIHSYKWVDNNSTTNNSDLAIRLINYIWKEYCPLNSDLSSVEGFEYWTGLYEAGDRREKKDLDDNLFYHLFRHHDKDEKEWQTSGKLICPLIGTIFYPHKDNDFVKGGDLKIWDTKESPITGQSFELIRPKFNRLVIFDPSYLHAVTMVTGGTRRAIAINLWQNKPSTFLF